MDVNQNQGSHNLKRIHDRQETPTIFDAVTKIENMNEPYRNKKFITTFI